MSGYKSCACRDCFEIAIGEGDEAALCNDCEEADCSPDGDEECQGEHAYGGDWESDDDSVAAG